MEDLQQLFNKFSSIKVGIIGDVMLDTYLWGSVERISPEAPVPIVSLQKKEYRVGGAGNVAFNLTALGAAPFVLAITGKDEEGEILSNLLSSQGINTEYSIISQTRKTTNKIRVIGRNQQMMRLDSETIEDIEEDEQNELILNFQRFVNTIKPDAVIFEDYNKGLLTPFVIEQIIAICKESNIITAVDPKRKNFLSYKGVDIFKPNLKEVVDALNIIHLDVDINSLNDIHQQLNATLQHQISLITLSEKGIFYDTGNDSSIIPSHIRNIADVSGAGDTVIAVAILVYAASRNPFLMAEVANIAGGLVCEEVGTAAINKNTLVHECEMLLS
jgi:rfaE bifunctional protein kinase chain/domain